MKKIFQKFFQGHAVLEEVQSPINGKIQVWEDLLGKRKLMVGGLTQSGGTVEKIWRTAMKQYKNLAFGKNLVSRFAQNSNLTISHCLILGLGAGSAARVINKFFPGAKILGIEIDEEMLRLGKKYFGLDKVRNLRVNVGDATNVSRITYHVSRKFDLILVDLYLGDKTPKESETEEFLLKIAELLTNTGFVIFNRLYYGDKKQKTDEFGENLQKFFAKIEAKKVKANKLFLCQNEATN